MATAPTPQRASEALQHFEAQLGDALTPELKTELESEVKKRANTVAPAALATLVTSVWMALEKAEAEGMPIADALADVDKRARTAWVGTATQEPARVGGIARAFAFGMLAVGRDRGFTVMAPKGNGDDNTPDPNEVTHKRYDAVGDDRTTDVCAGYDGTILPVDDPFWSKATPPTHFGCRSILVELTRREAESMGVTPKAPAVHTHDGFGSPDKAWEPSASDYPPEIRAIYEARYGKLEAS